MKGWWTLGPQSLCLPAQVIDEAMVEHRMSEQRRLRPNDGEFYIMELGQSLFVDAKEKGNLMRLINHRCAYTTVL